MEPVHRVIGQAAGAAAKMAIDEKVPIQEVDAAGLRSRLQNQKAVLEWGKTTGCC